MKKDILTESERMQKLAGLIGNSEALNENEEKTFKFKVKHDKGTTTMSAKATTADEARKRLANAENAPEHAFTHIAEDIAPAGAAEPHQGTSEPGKEEKMYLDYVNNFGTVDRFAEYYGISAEEAYSIIERGRNKNNKVNETAGTSEDNKIGINLRSLLDGELAMAIRDTDFNDYEQRNKFISKIEERLKENDWISMSNGTTFEKTFTPSQK